MLSILYRGATLRTLAAALVAVSTVALPAVAHSQTIGDALIDRGTYDTFTGFILVSPFSFGAEAYGKEVGLVSIFDGFVGRSFTPLVLNSTGSNSYSVAAIGTQRTVANAGLLSYDFGTVSGSALIGATTRLAWMSPIGQVGAIAFDNGGGFYGATNSNEVISAVNESFTIAGSVSRAYSIQFTAVNVATVPEPTSLALMGVGLLMVGAISRRRRSN